MKNNIKVLYELKEDLKGKDIVVGVDEENHRLVGTSLGQLYYYYLDGRIIKKLGKNGSLDMNLKGVNSFAAVLGSNNDKTIVIDGLENKTNKEYVSKIKLAYKSDYRLVNEEITETIGIGDDLDIRVFKERIIEKIKLVEVDFDINTVKNFKLEVEVVKKIKRGNKNGK